MACRFQAGACERRSSRRRRRRGPGGRERGSGARRRSATALAGREARRIFFPGSVRLGRRGAPGHHGRRAALRLGRTRVAWRCCRITAPAMPNGTSPSRRRLLRADPADGPRLPGAMEALDSGALRPKKSQLAVFGLTRHIGARARASRTGPVRELLFRPCQFRRAPYLRARPRLERESPPPAKGAVLGEPEGPPALGRRTADARNAARRRNRRALPLRRHHLHQHGAPAGIRLRRGAGAARGRLSHPRASVAARSPAIPATPACASTSPKPAR